MHTVLGLSSVLLVLFGGYVLLSLLRYVKDWSQRRAVQFFLLTMPLITLGIGVGGLHDFVGHRCFIDILFWDSLIGVMLPLCMAAIACGACCWGIARWLFLVRLIARRGISIGPVLSPTMWYRTCTR